MMPTAKKTVLAAIRSRSRGEFAVSKSEFVAEVVAGETLRRPEIPSLKTERLFLRPITVDDAGSIFSYARNPNVSRYTLWESHQSVKDTETFILDYVLPQYAKGDPEPLGVVLKDRPEVVIGTVGCCWVDRGAKHMELAYAFAEEYWGLGLATEAAKVILNYCFASLDVERIQARCKSVNKASSRVMEKIGMKYEGTLRSSIFHRGEFLDMDYYSILRQEEARFA